MKTLKITIFFILSIYAAQCNAQYDSIFAEVSHDTVTLWQTAAYRNCASYFSMEIKQNEYKVTWNQIYINNIWTSCNCFFDLSVTFLVPSPGSYHADVYSKYGFDSEDSIYEGSIDFEVGDVYNQVRSEIIGQYQSDCYHNVGVNEESLSMTTFNLYPNPLREGDHLNLEAVSTGGKPSLEIFSMTGILVFCKQYNGNQPIRESLIKEEFFPVSGIYIVRLKTFDNVYIRKITVL